MVGAWSWQFIPLLGISGMIWGGINGDLGDFITFGYLLFEYVNDHISLISFVIVLYHCQDFTN